MRNCLSDFLIKNYNWNPNLFGYLSRFSILETGFFSSQSFVILSRYFNDLFYDLNILLFNEHIKLIKTKKISDFGIIECKMVTDKICLNLYSKKLSNNYLKTFDDNINEIASIQIENKKLIGASNTEIFCLSDFKNESPLLIYNWSLECIKSMGQRDSPNDYYFFGHCIRVIYSHDKYFIEDFFHKLNIMDESTGEVIKTIDIKHNKFEIDSNGNIIIFELNRLIYYDSNGYYLKDIQLNYQHENGSYWNLDKNSNDLYYFDPIKFYLK